MHTTPAVATSTGMSSREYAEFRMTRRRRAVAVGLVPLLLATSAAPLVAMVVH
jgi:hypothetical protein